MVLCFFCTFFFFLDFIEETDLFRKEICSFVNLIHISNNDEGREGLSLAYLIYFNLDHL